MKIPTFRAETILNDTMLRTIWKTRLLNIEIIRQENSKIFTKTRKYLPKLMALGLGFEKQNLNLMLNYVQNLINYYRFRVWKTEFKFNAQLCSKSY